MRIRIITLVTLIVSTILGITANSFADKRLTVTEWNAAVRSDYYRMERRNEARVRPNDSAIRVKQEALREFPVENR